MARPRYDYEVGEADHVMPTVPCCDFGERVSADDEVEDGVERAEFFNGVDGVALAGAFFDPGRHEARVRLAGQFHHSIALFVGGSGGIDFVGRMSRWDEEDAVEVEVVCSFAGYDDVSVVDRVKGTPKESESQLLIVIGFQNSFK